MAFILPSATVVFSLSSSQTGLLGSSVLIGYLFGALLAGLLGDLIGRKRVMMYALAIYAAASVVASCLSGPLPQAIHLWAMGKSCVSWCPS